MADGIKIVVDNRKARHEFTLEDRFEAGLVLTGSEVKSLRDGKVNLQESFIASTPAGMEIVGLHIAPYERGGYANHVPTRKRRLLLNRREIERLQKGVERQGYTVVPTKIYFKGGRAKVEIALGKGKKVHDKRHDIAERDAKRRIQRALDR